MSIAKDFKYRKMVIKKFVKNKKQNKLKKILTEEQQKKGEFAWRF